MSKIPSFTPTLLALPDELLDEILNLLDCKSLLAIKSTCQHMRAITRTHLVGISNSPELLFRFGAPVLEGPVENYSVEELERKVLRRLNIQEKWRKPNPSTFRSRKINVKFDTRGCFQLLPGGRWFLDNIHGYVYVIDLDKPDSEPQVLFEEVHRTYHGHYVDSLNGHAIWIDSSKPWLSLRMALHNNTERLDSSRICIYQLDFRGQTADSTWVMKPLVTLMCPGPCVKSRLRLGSDYVVERCWYKKDAVETWKVHIFRYSEPGPRLFVWEYSTAATIFPLPGNRLVAITDSGAHAEIFNIRIPTDSQSLTLETLFRLPLHPSPTLWVSQLYTDHRCAYIVTTCQGSIGILQVPHEVGLPPSVRRIPLDVVQDYVQVSGLSVMFILQKDYSMSLITFNPRGKQNSVESHASVRNFSSRGFLDLLACDEASGRILMLNKGFSVLEI